MDDFLWRALFAGLGVVALAAPLGTFVVWRRMAYFGDTLSHAALLGVVLGVVLGLDLQIGIVLVTLVLAVLLLVLGRQKRLASDTLLGILAHSTLSLGLVAIAFLPHVRVDLLAYLFGDILAVSEADLVWIWVGAAGALALLGVIWRPLLALTVHEDLARVEGVPVWPVQLAFLALIALTIALAMKIVGVLLITSLLIIPAATARRFARTPEQMAALAVVAGALAVAGGLGLSLRWDTPAGPSVVAAAAALFLLSHMLPQRQ
ncbi:zinc ABC transporter permease subunit ZnuB [Ectothiorhodospiraceae bacterium 2226]|nr:zinc ABC transporter permease subunit ZnuB [Ectothiorhodospiraceae bacterium 2226]